MKIDIGTMFGIIGTLSAIVFGYIAYSRNKTNDSKTETKEDTEIKASLDTKVSMILDDVKEVKITQRSFNDGFDKFKLDMTDKVARIEESTKQAHKRLDALDKGK